jgi:hypothetical protein
LLGCLLASTEAALMGIDTPELTAVRDGYRSQIDNGDDGTLRLLPARLDLLVLQLAAHPSTPVGDVGAARAASQAAMAANGLLGVHLLTRPDQTGRLAEPALLREFLREVKQHVANTRRGFDRVLDTLRGRGV